jgi:AcrR family transcriptional regulator
VAFVSTVDDLLGPTDSDGRRARRDLNRRAVVDALLDLYREGRYDPSSTDIAMRAGLSPRSLFRYFDDVDDLARAAITVAQDRARALLTVAATSTDPLERRIECLLEARANVWDTVGPAARVSRMRAPLQPVIAAELTQARAYLRKQLRELFAPELAALGPGRSPAALATIDVLCSFESYDLLRNDQRLSRPRAISALAAALRAVLEP